MNESEWMKREYPKKFSEQQFYKQMGAYQQRLVDRNILLARINFEKLSKELLLDIPRLISSLTGWFGMAGAVLREKYPERFAKISMLAMKRVREQTLFLLKQKRILYSCDSLNEKEKEDAINFIKQAFSTALTTIISILITPETLYSATSKLESYRVPELQYGANNSEENQSQIRTITRTVSKKFDLSDLDLNEDLKTEIEEILKMVSEKKEDVHNKKKLKKRINKVKLK